MLDSLRVAASVPGGRIAVGRPNVADVEAVQLPGADGGIPLQRYRPDELRRDAVIVVFHGGGPLLHLPENADGICRTLAVACSREVVAVSPRLPPEHRFPAAADDALDAVRRLAAEDAGRRLVLVGDGFGGNLAAVTTMRLRDHGDASVILQVLAYPFTDRSVAPEAFVRHPEHSFYRPRLERFWSAYARTREEHNEPLVSPLRAPDLSGLPAAYVIVAECDPLRDQGIAYAARLADADVRVTVDRYHDMVHGFLPMVGLWAQASTAINGIAAQIRAALRTA
jgi:acetyl esterase